MRFGAGAAGICGKGLAQAGGRALWAAAAAALMGAELTESLGWLEGENERPASGGLTTSQEPECGDDSAGPGQDSGRADMGLWMPSSDICSS